MRKLLLATLMALLFTVCAVAQDDDDTGLWIEPVVTKTLNKRVDLVLGARFETKANNSEVQEDRFYGGFNIKFGKTKKWSIQPQYTYVTSANRAGRYYNEHRPTVIINRRFQEKGSKWSFSLGSRNEFRIRPGKNDFRFVPLAGIERSLNAKTKIFNRNEFWMDTRKKDPTQYRFRSFFGFNRTLNKNLAVEPFILYQRDQKFSPHNVYKFGMFLRIKL